MIRHSNLFAYFMKSSDIRAFMVMSTVSIHTRHCTIYKGITFHFTDFIFVRSLWKAFDVWFLQYVIYTSGKEVQVTLSPEVLQSVMIYLMVKSLAFTSSRISLSMFPSVVDDIPSQFAQVSCFVMCEKWLSCLMKHHVECQRNCLMVLLCQVKPIIQDNLTRLLST